MFQVITNETTQALATDLSVEDLYEKYERAGSAAHKEELARQICLELIRTRHN